MASNPPRPAEMMDVDDREPTEDTRSIVSQPTAIARSHTQGESSNLGFMERVRARTVSPTRIISAGSRNQIQRIEQILGRFDPRLITSHDSQHLAMSALSSEARQMAEELNTVKTQLSTGATLIGRELQRIDETMDALDQETQRVQEDLARQVAQRLEAADSR